MEQVLDLFFMIRDTIAGKIDMNIALRRFLHTHGNIATEGSPKPGLCHILISNDLKGSLQYTVP